MLFQAAYTGKNIVLTDQIYRSSMKIRNFFQITMRR